MISHTCGLLSLSENKFCVKNNSLRDAWIWIVGNRLKEWDFLNWQYTHKWWCCVGNVNFSRSEICKVDRQHFFSSIYAWLALKGRTRPRVRIPVLCMFAVLIARTQKYLINTEVFIKFNTSPHPKTEPILNIIYFTLICFKNSFSFRDN